MCKTLQPQLCDLSSASDHFGNIVERFMNMRLILRTTFKLSSKNPKHYYLLYYSDVGEVIKIPRLPPTQHHRFNVHQQTPKQYFTIVVAIPLLQEFVNQLVSRFMNPKERSLSDLTLYYCHLSAAQLSH